MSISIAVTPHSAETPPWPVHRFTVEQYHQLGVKEYWIINLVEYQFEQFTDSDGTMFRKSNILKACDTASIQIDSQLIRLDLSDVLGK